MITLREIWNKAIEAEYSDRKFEPRDYVYASELGGSMFDTYHKLKGTIPTHPPNARARRKFNMGNLLEWNVKLVLIHAGVLKEDQRRVIREPKGNSLGIHGRTDFILSPSQKKDIDFDIPQFMVRFVEDLELDKFGDTILELKSISSMLFPSRVEEPAPNHRLQAGFYSVELGLPALITYISKDDCMMAEHYIKDPQSANFDINEWVDEVSGYYHADEQPPFEDLIINEGGRVKKNWKVEYSGYLSMYGFETPEEYRNKVDKPIARWNRVLKKMQNEEKLTSDNERAIDEMRTYFKTGEL